MDIPKYIKNNQTGTVTGDNATMLFYCLYSNYDIRYVHGNDLGFVKNYFVFSVLNDRDDIKCIGCDLDGKFVPVEKLNKTIQFYINQIMPPTPEKYYMVHNIMDCKE